MNIAMFTNTYLPHVGGVAHSVSGLANGLRQAGHNVLVIAPEFPGMPRHEDDVVRITAVQRFAGSDFSVPLPITGSMKERLEIFEPDIVHSHHPFLLGDSALRVSATWEIPIVYTFHTRYELYNHYVVQDSEFLRRMVRSLYVGYCNMCNAVIAPSLSSADHLVRLGVTAPVSVIPTGVDIAALSGGDGDAARARFAIPPDAPVIGHVGRLAREKNLDYLAAAIARCLADRPDAHALFVGDGDMRPVMRRILEKEGVGGRAHFAGILTGRLLADAYRSMSVFAFSSLSETQGLVLAEAMAAGVPVVALDAPGACEVVHDGLNGYLLPDSADPVSFAAALGDILKLDSVAAGQFGGAAREAADDYSTAKCHGRVLALYRSLLGEMSAITGEGKTVWQSARRSIARELDILGNIAHAVGDAVLVP